jgi:hypothetical protein
MLAALAALRLSQMHKWVVVAAVQVAQASRQ